MTHLKPSMKGIVFAASFLVAANAALADSSILCAPFRHNHLIDQALVSRMLSAAKSGNLYLLQPTVSNFGFGVESIFGRIEAVFTSFQGGISLQQTQEGPALVRIKATSLQTSGFFIRNMLKGSSFFDVQNFPDVYFASKSLLRTGPSEGLLVGDLTLRGITRPVIFSVDLGLIEGPVSPSDEIVELKATTTIQRSDFGMGAFPSLAEDEVDLSIELVAQRYSN
ncbi:MAG: YceI family protein [Sedimenticola sp.]